ncbi:MAG: hypothetical protein QNK35_08430 [Bacteroides sp.]|nr:hypothetical protein [Bacteroides sp.]
MKTNFKLKLFFRIVVLITAGLIFNQCDEDSNQTEDIGGVAEGSYIVTNSSDPEFVKLVTENGEVVNVFGKRDANGLPEVVQQINITNENGEIYSFYYDDNKKLTTVVADNGSVFNYEWISDDRVVLIIDCNDGVNQINTEINLNELETYKSVEINANATMRDAGDRCFDIEFTPIAHKELETRQLALKSLNAYGTTYDLYTTSCGAPIFQPPSRVYLKDQSGSVFLTEKELSAQSVSMGHYSIIVPSGSAPSIDPQAAVEKLTAILTPICDAAGLYGAVLSPAACAYIAAKLALTGIGVTVAPGVGIACTGITSALAIYCKTLGASGPPGLPSIMDKLNELKLLDYFKLTGNMRMYVEFPGLLNNTTKAFTISEGVSATLNVELSENGEPSIRSLSLNPSSPVADQDYTVSVSVFCVPVGSTVSISMVGTDGYAQYEDYTISDPMESAGIFKMTVLGAETGVRDEITVEIRTSSGQTITRSASLIFGN